MPAGKFKKMQGHDDHDESTANTLGRESHIATGVVTLSFSTVRPIPYTLFPFS